MTKGCLSYSCCFKQTIQASFKIYLEHTHTAAAAATTTTKV
jgi:hypothetical protein